MTAAAKSSRKRMASRAKGYVKSKPAVYYRNHPKTQEEVTCANRALRRAQASQGRK